MIAVLPFDALGMDEARVTRLESLFRNELERLARSSGPTRRTITALFESDRKLGRCSGETECLAAIGKKLGTNVVVSGNVAALGDSYVVNIKAVDVAGGTEIGRVVSDPLEGNPDELIEAVRVAAYRLLAPGELVGRITLLADVDGAEVTVDGNRIGVTPLSSPIGPLALGPHRIEVRHPGFSGFSQTVEVRFQKTTRVAVLLAASEAPTPPALAGLGTREDAPVVQKRGWYQSTWFIVGVGVVAIGAGAVIGWQLGKDTVIDCTGGMCGPP